MMPTGPMSPERYTIEREQAKEGQTARPHRVRLMDCSFSGLLHNGAVPLQVKTKMMFFVHPEVASMFAASYQCEPD